mmetsp:Transcript_1688/g.1866  ORF Transcript_1688/g.1866 Transcript_1688/m.1866 type:complete len:316 (+) Transcript_1688:32-979(+)
MSNSAFCFLRTIQNLPNMIRHTPRELSVTIPNGLTIGGRIWGQSTATNKVLCIHGFLDNAATFDVLIPRLLNILDEPTEFVCMDCAGHGNSSHRSKDGQYCYTNRAMDAIQVATALGWDKFSLMSHSMGANTSVLIAGIVPDRIIKTVCIDCIGPPTRELEETTVLLRKHIEMQEKMLNRKRRLYKTRDEAVSRITSLNPFLKPSSATYLCNYGMKEVEGGFMFKHDLRLSFRFPPNQGYSREQTDQFLKAITCPLLLFWASPNKRNYKANEQRALEYQALIKDFRKINVDAGHHFHLDEPELCDEHIAKFFSTK